MLLASLALVLTYGPPSAAPNGPHARAPRICRVEERLGTILPHRTCRTAAEWQVYDRAAGRIHEQDLTHIEAHFTTQTINPKP